MRESYSRARDKARKFRFVVRMPARQGRAVQNDVVGCPAHALFVRRTVDRVVGTQDVEVAGGDTLEHEVYDLIARPRCGRLDWTFLARAGLEVCVLFAQRAALEPVAAEVVKLRYFAGLTAEQAALALGISVRTANRHWAYARAWLYRRLNPADETSA